MKNNHHFAGIFFVSCLVFSFLSVTTLYAQHHDKYWNKFINVGYSSLDIDQDGIAKISSDWGASFSVGTTYYLHKEPVANCLHFGLDAVWLDLNYCQTDMDYDNTLYKGEIGMQIGPSIAITPTKNLNLRGYFRYAPCYSGFYKGSGSVEFDDIQGAFASCFVGGGTISYGFFGVGIEARFGDSKHESLANKYMDSDEKIKTKFSGYRAYISFRF